MLEVFVDAPLSVCEERDPKGLYKRARAGELPNFTGIDSPFEIPLAPHVVCQTNQETVAMSVSRIVQYVLGHKDRLGEPTVTRRPTIAVDLDGVIADYDGWRGTKVIGRARKDVILALRELRNDGWKIIVHTTRRADDVRAYLICGRVPFDEINQNSDYVTGGQKPVATVYWDDRAVTYSGDAFQDLIRIRSFRTWNKRV
jgi:hypothetical protein